MCITYIFFHRACKAQGLDRKTLAYTGYLQPFCAWFALVWLIIVTFIYGYTSFTPWSVSNFFANYTMQLFIPPLFFIWKFIKRTKVVKPHECDLVWEKPIVDAYEETFIDPPVGFWTEMMQLVGLKRRKGGNDHRRPSIIVPQESLSVRQQTGPETIADVKRE
jgi:yeast amino acid transporter